MPQFDVLVLTALLTILALVIVSAALVVNYRRTHAAQLHQELIRKATRLGVQVDPGLDERQLRLLIKQARGRSPRIQPNGA